MKLKKADIKIVVAAHKPYQMPVDKMYLPVQVGASGKESIGYIRDDEGENISHKNKNYCELTGLYWAWKNTKSDYLGLVHYRRHFARKKVIILFSKSGKWNNVVDFKYLTEKIFNGANDIKIILPLKRNYFIETNYSQYIHAHHAEDLDITQKILQEKYPDYIKAYKLVMKDTKGHRFNMFIMERSLADQYCAWLFDILFELEKRLDISNYSDNDKRVFGFVSERLLDVWIEKNRFSYVELPALYMEKRSWVKKITNFILRKIKYKRAENE